MPAPTVASALLLLLLRRPHGREQHLSATAAHAHEFPEESFNHNLFTKKWSVQWKSALKIIDDVIETASFGGGRTDGLEYLHFSIICSKCKSNQLRK